MLNEELSVSLQSHSDLSKLLTDDDLQELTLLANEPLNKDTMTLSQFNNIMDQWRMK